MCIRASASYLNRTGATGYIGGQVLRDLVQTHPDYEVTALVRHEAKAAQVLAAYPAVKMVIGSLDDAALMEQQAADADVVLHLAATAHLDSVKAIHRGLAKSSSGTWIQVSGAALLCTDEIASRKFGEASDKIFDDLDGINELREWIRKYPNRAVDNYVLEAATDESDFKTALVFPPNIYGEGQGPVNQRSVQIPELVRVTLERGKGIKVGKGLSRWANVHIHDVSKIFIRLVEKATFSEISQTVADAAKAEGIIPEATVEPVSAEEADESSWHGGILWGTNARSKASRAKKLLGWEPVGESLANEIPRALRREALRMGMKVTP